ncbi:citrate lyase [Nesterenkonia sp. AN1]|uniref:Citrate lyase subunit beta/citryl-CoA lyase n=1 Tax=Nesterenkonia aurantiaca TaxID=1436010 RepID=A0A4R7G5S0_9MICC|nr:MULTISPECIES: CoA ester lyase [Nesterenkonia]EXF24881.1 citrate lyase [Nesterenkonia sp. AN1]TDS86814.1 citrate lyase subunit beta/citryl-CoA lyase [Nesterenkonia aurantiaca]
MPHPTARFALGPALLFCPASRPELFAKAAGAADAVIIDLEDAVISGEKDIARNNMVQALNWGDGSMDPRRTLVRVNAPASGELEADLRALSGTEISYVVIAKAEQTELLDQVAAALPGVGLIPQIETPVGVLNDLALAQHPATVALLWGTEDLIAGIGGTTSRNNDGSQREIIRFTRNRLLLTAGAVGVPIIDAVFTRVPDLQRLAVETEDACASGFIGKACIHPKQIAPIRQAYTPTASDLEWAKGVIAAFENTAGLTPGAGHRADPDLAGAFSFRGEMIDMPVITQVQRILTRFESIGKVV